MTGFLWSHGGYCIQVDVLFMRRYLSYHFHILRISLESYGTKEFNTFLFVSIVINLFC